MIDFETILEAYLDCRKRKRSTVGATEFELNYVHNLVELMNEVNSRQYRIGKSICFVVRYPRYREVFAGEFRDRVVHHYIALRLEPLFERIFCGRTCNCRKGKGQLAGVTQLAEDIREESENYTKDAYVMKVDLKGFFMSIIKSKLAKMIDDFIVAHYEGDDKEDLRWLCNLVIMHRPELNCERRSPLWMWNFIPKEKSLFTNGEDRGIAIGNLFAQLFANFLLNTIDWKIDAVCVRHNRYVDDISFVSKDKEKLLSTIPMLRTELGKLGLRLNEKFSMYKGANDAINAENRRAMQAEFGLYKSQVDADFGLYKNQRDQYDALQAKFSDLDKKVAVMEALTPYKEKLMMAYVKENTCNCLRGQLMLPNTPVLQGFGSYSGCNCTAPSTPTTGA